MAMMIHQSALSVAFLLPSLRGGGAERVSLNLAKGFSQRGHSPILVLGQAEGSYLDQVPESIPVAELKVSHMRYSLFRLARFLRKKQPDIVVSTMSHVNVLALLARRFARVPTKVVVTEHTTFTWMLSSLAGSDRMLLPLLMRTLYPEADAVVAVSQGIATELVRPLSLPRERITVIYNPVVDDRLYELAQEYIVHPWFHDHSFPLIIAAGRLTSPKDYRTLLRAFALLRRRHPARLVVLGEGEERSSLEGLALELGVAKDTSFLGFQDNPYKYMAKANVFVLSSRAEGLPTVLIEAMACGTPVVATDCPSGPREILGGGKYGLLVPVGDEEALAEVILKVLQDCQLGERLSQAGRQRAQDFHVRKVVRQYEELFLSLVTSR